MLQVDIAPTLALLFGVPIPHNNVGVMIPGMIDSFKGKCPPCARGLNWLQNHNEVVEMNRGKRESGPFEQKSDWILK